MTISQEYLIPFIITNLLSLVLLFVSIKWSVIGKIIFAIIFLIAGVFNIFNVINHPDSYLEFGKTAILFFYRDFIFGDFRDNIVIFIIIISALQLFISLCLLTDSPLTNTGFTGGIIFLILIAPLGLGSAFPSTLLMALALYIMYLKRHKIIRERMRSRP